MRIVVEEGPGALERHEAAWEALAASALEPNVFQEGWFALAAARTLGRGVDLRTVLVYEGELLVGAFPLERVGARPLPHYRLWAHDHCPLGTPLVHRDRADACLDALFGWMAGQRELYVAWPLLHADGPFLARLRECAGRRGLRGFERYPAQRPLLVPGAQAEAYLEAAVAGPARKVLRRRERRLREMGTVSFRSLAAPDDAARWIGEFLELEASGWKSARGTALKSSAATREFFTRIAGEAARRGRLEMRALDLEGAPIAMLVRLRAGDGAFAFKIAYDERYAACGPGVLLEVEAIRRVHEAGGPRWIDACTASEGPLDGLWTGRRRVIQCVMSTGTAASAAAVAAWAVLRAAKARLEGRRGAGPAAPRD